MEQCSEETGKGRNELSLTLQRVPQYSASMQVPQYHTYCKRYSYTPDENSLSNVGLKRKLSQKNYASKFHKLVYLDEIEHCRKMANL